MKEWIPLLMKWNKGTKVSLVQATIRESQEKENKEKAGKGDWREKVAILQSVAGCFIVLMMLPNLEIEFCTAE